MTQYITKYKVMSRRGAGFSWTMGYIEAGIIFDSNNQKNGWVEFSAAHWIPAQSCQLYDGLPPDPPVDHPDASLWWTICREKSTPKGYKPQYPNWGSFAIMWLMSEEPGYVLNKPEGFKLKPHHIEYVKHLNPQNSHAVQWMVAEGGTSDKVLSVNDYGQYRCPVPCCVEANQVNILEWGARAVRIQTVSIYEPLPATLPNYLCHQWFGYTKGGTFYRVEGASGGINYPLFARSNSAWIQRSGIQLNPPI